MNSSSTFVRVMQCDTGPYRLIAGHVHGRRQPSLAVSVRARHAPHLAQSVPRAQDIGQELSQILIQAFGVKWNVELADPQSSPWQVWVASLGQITVRLLEAAGLPVFEAAQTLRLAAPGTEHKTWSTLLLPVAPGWPAASWHAWQLTLQAVAHAAAAAKEPENTRRLEQGWGALKSMVLQGANTPRFLKAAYDNHIPVIALDMGVFQYGYGRYAEWLDSTLTQQTSNIAVRLARDKQVASARLRQAGLPVPSHVRVDNAQDAVRAAQQLGYPVVVKPLDQDGGQGVTAGLENEAELRMAYERAFSFSPKVLVEKHVQGRDYRLTVLDDALLWAIERTPAGVTGDGQQSVAQLIEQENLNPERGDDTHSPLKPLVFDEEALRVLRQQGYGPDSVPQQGQFVALRRIANVATGGRPMAVNEQVHPDNARLAVRAAQALRLDLAGVDLLIPDISKSWRETGAAICEVNAQPQLGATTGPHLYAQILRHRLKGEGRVPVVVVVGAHEKDGVIQALVRSLRSQGLGVGWSDLRGAGVNEEWLTLGESTVFASGQMLLTDRRVEALVLSVHDDEVLRQGMPVDRIDWLVLAGSHLIPRKMTSAPSGTEKTPAVLLNEVLASILPACCERVIVLVQAGMEIKGLERAVVPGCSVETITFNAAMKLAAERWGR